MIRSPSDAILLNSSLTHCYDLAFSSLSKFCNGILLSFELNVILTVRILSSCFGLTHNESCINGKLLVSFSSGHLLTKSSSQTENHCALLSIYQSVKIMWTLSQKVDLFVKHSVWQKTSLTILMKIFVLAILDFTRCIRFSFMLIVKCKFSRIISFVEMRYQVRLY